MRIICLSNTSAQGTTMVTISPHCVGSASIHLPSWIRVCYGVSPLQVYKLTSLEIHSGLFNPVPYGSVQNLFYFHISHLGTYHGMENVTFNIHHQTTCTWYN
jgi:hypothetical protein